MIAEELRPDMYSYLNLGDSRTAYIIGNGNSRRGLDLSILDGDVWGVMHCLETTHQITLQL